MSHFKAHVRNIFHDSIRHRLFDSFSRATAAQEKLHKGSIVASRNERNHWKERRQYCFYLIKDQVGAGNQVGRKTDFDSLYKDIKCHKNEMEKSAVFISTRNRAIAENNAIIFVS